MNLSAKQKQIHKRKEQLVAAEGEGLEGGMNWEFGISRCKLLYTEWINKKVLLYSSGNYSQYPVQFSSVQPQGHVQLFATPWTAARQASLSITNCWSLFRLIH